MCVHVRSVWFYCRLPMQNAAQCITVLEHEVDSLHDSRTSAGMVFTLRFFLLNFVAEGNPTKKEAFLSMLPTVGIRLGPGAQRNVPIMMSLFRAGGL